MVAFMVERVRRERKGFPLIWADLGWSVCFLMSATADFDQGIRARYGDAPLDWASWDPWHVAILSVGIPVILALTGEALGRHLAGVAAQNVRHRQAWQAEMDEWYRKLSVAWAARQRKRASFHLPSTDLPLQAPRVPSN